MLEGQGIRKVLLLSERSWQGRHWMMQRLLTRARLDRDLFYFSSIENPNLFADIKAEGIKVVVCLGEPVLRRFLGETGLMRWRGRPVKHPSGVWTIATVAPHMLLPRKDDDAWDENPMRFCGVWMLDVQNALHIAQNGYERNTFTDYLLDPDVSRFERWVEEFETAWQEDNNILLSVDIETPYKQKNSDEEEMEEGERDAVILRISFSWRERHAVTVQWIGPYLGLIKRLLAHPGIKVFWNGWSFDIPVLESNDAPVKGLVYDGMDMFRVYQSDLPRGLEWVTSFATDMLPWKHLNNSDPALYSAIDPDAALRNVNWLRKRLEATNRWRLYEVLYARLSHALDVAGRRNGNDIDVQAREELRVELQAEFDRMVGEAQTLVPEEVKPRQRYKRQPKELVQREGVFIIPEQEGEPERKFEPVTVRGEKKFCSHCGEEASNKSEHFKGTTEVVVDAKGKEKQKRIPNLCKAAGAEIVKRETDVVEWDEILPFNPNSTEQMKAYIRHFGHPMGHAKDDSSKEAADASHLKKLKKKYGKEHPIYQLSLDLKKVSKTRGTYLYDRTDDQGLIHQTYVNSPSTPRLGGRNYNLMNVGKREENYWAKRARRQIVARNGRCFVQADSSAIEAYVQGWWMGDRQYMELASQSVHAFVVAKRQGIEWVGTEEQVAELKAQFPDLYNKMKTTNYLTNFGGTPLMMHQTDPDSFPSVRAAEQAQEMLYSLLPSLREYHHWVRTKAHKESYLQIPGWNFRHYYWDVFGQKADGSVKLSKDAKRCLALFPQGCAALFGRENLLLFAYGDQACEWLGIDPLGLGNGLLEWLPANVFVHDGYTIEPPPSEAEMVIDYCEKVLTRPIKWLGNIQVGCEIDLSPERGNWAPFHEEKNPMGLKTVRVCRVPVVDPPSAEDVRKAA